MGNLSEELMAKLNVETVFTIPIFGGIPVPEGVDRTSSAISAGAVSQAVPNRRIPSGNQGILLIL